MARGDLEMASRTRAATAVGQKLLAVVGPTASGKSALAVSLARELDGEIISADSRQVYSGMDIGTAKPSAEQRAAVPHHLVDVIAPDEEYSLAVFLRQARTAIHDIESRWKLPILVGGTGQYVWGLLEGWQVPEVPPDHELRAGLEGRARLEGGAVVYKELARLDPDAARRIDPRNVRRVIRALEVHHSSPDFSSRASRSKPPFKSVIVGLTLERAALYQRINERVNTMITEGWVGEVRALLGRGYGPDLPSMSSLGYKELAHHLDGEGSMEVTVERIQQKTRRFARQQYAWFRLDDERIRWFDGSTEGLDAAETFVKDEFA